MDNGVLSAKQLIATREGERKVEHHTLGMESHQAEFIRKRIQQLIAEGTALSEIAVLYRCFKNQQVAGKCFRMLELELIEARIPYRLTRDKKCARCLSLAYVCTAVGIAYCCRLSAIMSGPWSCLCQACPLWYTNVDSKIETQAQQSWRCQAHLQH